MEKLTAKEMEVAIFVAKGYKNEDIVEEIHVSRRRVNAIIANIKLKWCVESRVEIGVLAYHFGLYTLDRLDLPSPKRIIY
ncbi:LuxR C-terminal-related transcriptional regulator [Shouchella lonarensis]|nr:LuxR C-terminal-related transcriptional regulator [Shouchella lonarensis]